MRVYTHEGVGQHRQRVGTTFLTRKKLSQIVLVLAADGVRTLGLWICESDPIEPPRHPLDNLYE